MTKFIFNNSKKQIIVNALALNRDNVIYVLSLLFKKFPYPDDFTINNIKSDLNLDYSEKTIRSMIIIYEKMGFIERISPIHQKPIQFQFKKDLDLSDMIIYLSNMG